MKLITQITWEHIKKNRRSSFAVMTAVLLSATLLCSVCIFAYSFWGASVGQLRQQDGNWHGELYNNTPGEKLPYIESHPDVEAVMIKGDWQAARLPEGAAMPYLFLRDTNAQYWEDMSERNALLEGRLPEKEGELAVSKLFFERNPQYRLGDTLTLPMGNREMGGEILSLQSIRIEGETFRQTGERTFTLVGKLDLTTTTAYPGYYAMGFLERESIAPDDGLTIYLRFHNMRDTYRVLPEIAEAVGFEQDEYGDYPVRYSNLLTFYGIFDSSSPLTFQTVAIVVMAALVILLFVGTVVLIIRSVFSLSANARVKQLGMLRSVGASPGQIKRSILLEGVILSVLPLGLSVLLGYVFSNVMGRIYTNIVADQLQFPLDFGFSWSVALAGVVVSLICVLLAVNSTARRMAKLTPIEAVRGKDNGNLKRRKEKKHYLAKRMFGYPGVLARENMAAYRRTFRMPVAALCLSFVLVAGTLSIIGIAWSYNETGLAEDYFDAQAYLFLTQERGEDMIEEIRTMDGVQESLVYSSVDFGQPVTEQMQADEFTAIGGFAAVDQYRYNVIDHNDGWRIHGTLIGLDPESFGRYCDELGLDAAEYPDTEPPKAIAVSSVRTNPSARTREEQEHTIPFLHFDTGSVYTFEEKTYESVKSSHTFDVEIGAVTQKHPVTDLFESNYHTVLVVPLAQYDSIVEGFLPERASEYRRTNVMLKTDLDGFTAEERLDEICGSYLAGEDFITDSAEGELEAQRISNNGILAMASGIALIFALIGISNAFSTVSGNLAMRRRDFAMLRSAGMDDKEFGRVLLIEGMVFALRPIVLALPWVAALCAVMGYLLGMAPGVVLQSIPLGVITLYAAIILAAMGIAYLYGARSIRKGTIVEALRSNLV